MHGSKMWPLKKERGVKLETSPASILNSWTCGF